MDINIRDLHRDAVHGDPGHIRQDVVLQFEVDHLADEFVATDLMDAATHYAGEPGELLQQDQVTRLDIQDTGATDQIDQIGLAMERKHVAFGNPNALACTGADGCRQQIIECQPEV